MRCCKFAPSFLEQFEAQTNKLEERTQDKRSLPWLDEWREGRRSASRIKDRRLWRNGSAAAGVDITASAGEQLGLLAVECAQRKVLAMRCFVSCCVESDALGDERTSQLAKRTSALVCKNADSAGGAYASARSPSGLTG